MTNEENSGSTPEPADEPESRPGGVPLYVWVLIAVVFTAIRNSAMHAVTSAPQGCGGGTKVAAGSSCSWCRAPW